MGLVRKAKHISAVRRLVICHIGATADRCGQKAWRSNALVMEELGVSLDTVKDARKDAVDSGFLVPTSKAPRGAGNTKTMEYRLQIPAINSGSTAPIPKRNGGPRPPISSKEMGATDSINRGCGGQKIGAAEAHPSGFPSGFPSGLRHDGVGDLAEPHNRPPDPNPKYPSQQQKTGDAPGGAAKDHAADAASMDEKKPRPQLGAMVHRMLVNTNPARAGAAKPPPRRDNWAVREDLERHKERLAGIDSCELCDEHGYLGDDKCWHGKPAA